MVYHRPFRLYSREPEFALHEILRSAVKKNLDSSSANKGRWSAASSHLDFIRGMAAFAVFAQHLRCLMFVDYGSQNRGLLVKALYFATSLGHQAVIVFFVLSGFLVAGTAIRSGVAGRWSLWSYSVNRLTRLWVVLLPALLLGAMWDRIGIGLFKTQGVYGGGLDSIVSFNVLSRLNLRAMVGNAFFLQTVLVPPLGSNAALWSLVNEFWYYAAFGLVLTAVLTRSATGRVAAIAAIAAIPLLVGQSITLYFLVWLLGAAINFVPQANRRRAALQALAMAGFVAVLLLPHSISLVVSDSFLGIASAILIYSLLQSRAKAVPRLYASISHRFAGMSFSLYAVHMPLLVFIRAMLLGTTRWQPDARHLMAGAAIGATGLVYAWMISSFVEARTDGVRAWLFRTFSPLDRASQEKRLAYFPKPALVR